MLLVSAMIQEETEERVSFMNGMGFLHLCVYECVCVISMNEGLFSMQGRCLGAYGSACRVEMTDGTGNQTQHVKGVVHLKMNIFT